MRTEIPLKITLFFGLFMIVQYFVPHWAVNELAGRFQQWAVIVLAFAYVLGVANVTGENYSDQANPRGLKPAARHVFTETAQGAGTGRRLGCG